MPLHKVDPERPRRSAGCGHALCEDCWRGWLQAALDKGPESVNTCCAAFKCQTLVPPSFFAEVLGRAHGARFAELAAGEFVARARDLRWCPSAGCGAAVAFGAGDALSVECTHCLNALCVRCGQHTHEPVACDDAQRWCDIFESESVNVKWLKANTKACPNCSVPIEKNQGCSHMTCRACKHEFCWLCLGAWASHRSCGSYEAGRSAAGASDAARVRVELERFAHFAERHDAHAKAVRFAQQTRAEAEQRAGAVLESSASMSERASRFVVDAVNSVLRAHRTLQWTYVYGFFLDERDRKLAGDGDARPKSGARALFEANQAQLEELCDRLHEMTELENDSLGEQRQRCVEFTALLDKYRANVVASIEAGYDAAVRE